MGILKDCEAIQTRVKRIFAQQEKIHAPVIPCTDRGTHCTKVQWGLLNVSLRQNNRKEQKNETNNQKRIIKTISIYSK